MYVRIILSIAFVIWGLNVSGQDSLAISSQDLADYELEAGALVNYFSGTLNFLGNPEELVSEKDIIINNSYLKMFESSENQIEDDLDELRETPLNKDVQAYLKDVIFFYKQVQFQFEVLGIEQQINENNQIYFKVTTNRTLQGITIEGDSVLNNQVRYFEINLDNRNKQLKIASIYTTKLNEREELRNWWNGMSTAWKQVFGRSVLVFDTLPFMNILSFSDSSLITYSYAPDTVFISDEDSLINLNDSVYSVMSDQFRIVYSPLPDTIPVDPSGIYHLLKSFQTRKSIDISHNHVIRSLEPLAVMSDLHELNLSFTLIDDLSDIRNLNKLNKLHLEGSGVQSLESIRYLNNLNELNCGSTPVNNLLPIRYLRSLIQLDLHQLTIDSVKEIGVLPHLKRLNMSGVKCANYSGLAGLASLTDLNLSSSDIDDLKPLDSCHQLQSLNIDSTSIRDLRPLSGLSELIVIQANSTNIKDLTPLDDLNKLRNVYCDNSGITQQQAVSFMDNKPGCLVVFNSQHLLSWWQALNDDWKNRFIRSFGLSTPMTKEQLHLLISQKSMDLSYDKSLTFIEPLMMLHRLEELNLSHTAVENLDALEALNNLRTLDISSCQIQSLSPLSGLRNMEYLKASNTLINDLMPLISSENMHRIDADNTAINDASVSAYRETVPGCLVLFQSQYLRTWWSLLPAEWKIIFQDQNQLPDQPTDAELQQLANMTSFTLTDEKGIIHLEPLMIMQWLTKLSLQNTGVVQLLPLVSLSRLTNLGVTQCPLQDISMLQQMPQLKKVNLENTSVEDLEGLALLVNLEQLNLNGTRIRTLKSLSKLQSLTSLSISNTAIKNLKPIDNLEKLISLQCYNTPLKASKVATFKNTHPHTEVVYY